ncbi:MAG: hypothetical protein LBS62_02570, partial [Clostridiales bacterium]|nr:hypothetical protein [Clostridiales bacterium]
MSSMETEKTRRSIYTDARVENARKNIERYSWARQTRDSAVAAAEGFLAAFGERETALGETLRSLIVPQDIPRTYQLTVTDRCPVCGGTVNTSAWETDPLRHPWKVFCPRCGESYPKNDFLAYYRSAMDEYGVFRREQADPAFLRNTDPAFKDRGEGWCADDGLGWLSPP